MARPARISASAIEDAAFDLVREAGSSALTARGVADALGISTQPVYSAYASMDALRERVERRATAFIEDYLAVPDPDAPSMLSIGLRTVRLAIEEPQLFDLAAGWMHDRVGAPPPPPILAALRADPRLADATREQVIEANTLLWIFTLGLATLTRSGGRLTVGQARDYLVTAGDALIGQLTAHPST